MRLLSMMQAVSLTLPSNEVHQRVCAECGETFTRHWTLSYHASTTGHAAYTCQNCDATFSRLDVLSRHQLQHSPPSQKWSCTLCRKWKAPNGFNRKDHLTQHLRNYHYIEDEKSQHKYYGWLVVGDPSFHAYCQQEGCSLFRTTADAPKDRADALFPTRSAYTTHLRKEHNMSEFPCPLPGCKRTEKKGFFQKRALMRHMKKDHEVDYNEYVESQDS